MVSRSGGSASGCGSAVAASVLSPGSFIANTRLAVPAAGLVVGLDNACHEIAAHDIARVETDGLDALDPAEQPDGFFQSRGLPRGQVDLAGIAGDHHLRPF